MSVLQRSQRFLRTAIWAAESRRFFIEKACLGIRIYTYIGMRNSTPFFAAFGPLLFGRAPRGRLQDLLGQWPQMPSINQYMEAFGELIPQTLLARSKDKVNSRQRIFSPLVTFWAFLAQVLERGSSCRDALQRISAWWQVHFPGQGSPSADTSAYCQARARLDETVLQQIGSDVAEQLERQVTNDQLWLGRRVKIVDGTGLSMPDTAANQRQWPQSSGQKPGCGFPLLKIVGLFCLHSGALLQVAHDDIHHHEVMLARRLWQWLEAGEILLADRAFCSFLDIAQLLGRGVDCLMRLHQGRGKPDFRCGRRLGKNDCRQPSPCDWYDLKSPSRGFAPNKSFSRPRCSIRSFIRPMSWKKSISGAGTSNCTSDRSKLYLAWMYCAASHPVWSSKNWPCIGSLTISSAP